MQKRLKKFCGGRSFFLDLTVDILLAGEQQSLKMSKNFDENV